MIQPAKLSESSPPRIVCLTATGIDVLKELGLEPVGYLNRGIAQHPEFYGDRAQSFAAVGSWMLPDFRAIARLQPDLILGWRFPHRFYRPLLARIAPVHLMEGTGYEAATARLQQVAQLTGRSQQAIAAINQLKRNLLRSRNQLQGRSRKTVAVIGISAWSQRTNRYPVETQAGTLGGLLQQFVQIPWTDPKQHWGEAGLIYLSLQRIAEVDPDVILVQPFSGTAKSHLEKVSHSKVWQQLKAFKTGEIYQIPPFWHWGNGTRLMRHQLDYLLPLLYPEILSLATSES